MLKSFVFALSENDWMINVIAGNHTTLGVPPWGSQKIFNIQFHFEHSLAGPAPPPVRIYGNDTNGLY